MSGKRILIVDDEEQVRRVFKLALEEPGWEIGEAPTAEAALEQLRVEPFDLYLVDKNMPGMNGVELIREIRKTDVVARCILITGYANTMSAIESANLGLDAYIEKPCDMFELKERVEQLLSSKPRRASARFRDYFAHENDPAQPAGDGVEPTDGDFRANVVVASTHRGVRKQIMTCLPASSHTLHFASDEEEVMALFRREKIHVAVLHGDDRVVELVARIRKHAPTCRIILAVGALELPALKSLVELQVDAMLDVASNSFGWRLEELLRRLDG